MVDSQPKHKPNEKHTLDEVLKSLKDLVRNEVLDKSPPPAAASVPVAKPASSPSMGMGEIISSLEDLLDTDLTFEDKPKQPVTAAPPPAPEDSAPAAAAPELDEALEIEMTGEGAPQPAPNFPDEMSDEDIAKALADIELEMGIDAAPAPTAPAAELEFLDADDADAPITPAADDAAPALELTVQEPPAEAAEEGQRELPLTAFRRPPAATQDAAPVADTEPEEIAAAPPPTEPIDEKSETIELTSAPMEPAATNDAAPPAAIDSDFTIDFAPAQPHAQTAPPSDDELAPPPWEDDGTFERAEPPVHRGSRESAHGSSPSPSGGRNEDGGGFPDTSMFQPDAPGGSLGESIELDISGFSTSEPEPPPATETPGAEQQSAPLPNTEVIETVVEIIESETEVIEMAPDTLVPLPPGEIPVLKNVAVEGRTEPVPHPAETFTLELSPPAPLPPAPSSRDLHQVAVRVIAKLNIELRKAGKPPLDAKTINRLQQLLKEAMERKQ